MSDNPLVAPSIDPAEVAYFERLAHRWWDTEGPFWPLHRLNAFRVPYISHHLCTILGQDPGANQPLVGLRVLDIGCGGGILSESMARLGATVTGIDVTEKNLRVARLHACQSGLAIDYRLASVEQLAAEEMMYDAVLNLEVIEHVEHLQDFLATCAYLARPGGVMIVASINRTLSAWMMAILGAEYVLRWLPRGTHRYRKLVRPTEVIAGLGPDYRLIHRTGVRVNPFTRGFAQTRWEGVNYMLVMQRRLDS
ncbi:bifunctional 2-polyprenyl-6-hydroxyphenol methylase/3-demethylubiquinol 3-O-methyltransferase UbiG [Caldichromatium japonicum]|uniref:Ubiquinone biosynthesis O-methyltransferase n=1 Tax=Caldichromatium japonicum TaxID=2699430 RepID=A0A6G7VBM3_9GAMM|nr:bifunctional 2-polyprenyl-6-hydroxyphenol methylase/3-demethylubiquinol 3-O-methyltransferase UbiG [Caldichromatium japonicum]QIK37459.1 bifunctional 2-polyprenyl-6-hydroxyphenol methylase/3-demethylubiquinol 3-O-methyltransferase UbiG [Caldichromatium japonicum]